MTSTEIFRQVRKVVADILFKQEDEVKSESRIRQDLGGTMDDLHKIVSSLREYFPDVSISVVGVIEWMRRPAHLITTGMLVSYICLSCRYERKRMMRAFFKKMSETQ